MKVEQVKRFAGYLYNAEDGDEIPEELEYWFIEVAELPGFPFFGEEKTADSGRRAFCWYLWNHYQPEGTLP